MVNKHSYKNRKTFERIYDLVRSIPAGKVSTYGHIAAFVQPGLPARIVGYALHGLPADSNVPWHRVVNRFGEISFAASRQTHDHLQKTLLEKENIAFDDNGRIDLKRFQWQPAHE